MKTKFLMDIEVYPNFFCIGLKQYDIDRGVLFEISEERNDLDSINQ